MLLPDIQYTPSQSESIPNFLLKAMAQKKVEDAQAAQMLQQQQIQKERLAIERQDAERRQKQEQIAERRSAGDEHIKIRQLYEKDPRLAASYLQAIGAQNVGVEPVFDQPQDPLPPMPGGPPPGSPQMGAPPPPPPMAPQGMAGPRPGMMPPPGGQPPMGGGMQQPQVPQTPQTAEPSFEDKAAAETGAHLQALLEHPNHVAQTVDAVDAMKQAREAQQQPAAPPPQGAPVGHRLKYTMGGQETVLDPREMKGIRDAEMAGRAQQLEGSGVDPKYLKFGQTMLTMGVDPGKVGNMVAGMMEKDQSIASRQELAKTYQTTAEDKNKNAAMNARAHMMGAQASVASKEDSAAARASGSVDRAMTVADRMVDFKTLVQLDNSTRSLMKNAFNESALGHKDAQIQLARIFRGTTPTEGEMHMLYNNLGGTMDKWNQFVARLENGDLSGAQLAEVRGAATRAEHEVSERKSRTMQSLRTLGSDPGYRNVLPQINARLKARAQMVGVPFEDIQPEETAGGEGGAVLLGGSRKPKAGKPAGKANPLTDAAKAGGVPAAAISAARKRLSDPAETPERKAQAQRFLEEHGL